MIRKILGRILAVLAIFAMGLGGRLYSHMDERTGDYEEIDLYSINKNSYARVTNVTVEVDLVAAHINAPPVGKCYLVGSQYAGESAESPRMLIVFASTPETTEKLDRFVRLLNNNINTMTDEEPIRIQGYIYALPESGRDEIIQGLVSEGMTSKEAEDFFDENMMPLMFVEDETLYIFTHRFSMVIVIAGIVMFVGAIVLLVSAKNAGHGGSSRGYIHPSERNRRGFDEYTSPVRRDTTSMNTSSGSGYQSPSGNRSYQSPNPVAEPEVLFTPKMFKQPDYEEFFAPKRKKAEPDIQTISASDTETEIEKIVRDKHPNPKAVIREVPDMGKVDREAETLPVKDTDERPVVELPDADEDVVPAALELLDFDNAPVKTESNDSGLQKRADFWSNYEIHDKDVRIVQDLPNANIAGLDELGAVDEISVSSQSFTALREAPPEPEDIDYFTSAEPSPSFDMDLDEYLKTDYLDPERDD